jgi:hypothetical protein
VEIADAGGLAFTDFLTIKAVSGETYDQIVDYRLSAKPELDWIAADDEIPF